MDAFETREPERGVRTRTRPGPGSADELISVRRARASELDDVAALFAPALEPYRGSGSDWILDAYLAELLEDRMGLPETTFWALGERAVARYQLGRK